MKRYFNIIMGRMVFAVPGEGQITTESGQVIVRPTEAQLLAYGWEEYVTPTPTLEQVKSQKLAQIDAYDTSDAVNAFTLDGEAMWLDNSTRVSLQSTLEAKKAAGQGTIDLWSNGGVHTLSVSDAERMLAALELYAYGCYGVTARHKADVQALTTIEAVEAYDITAGYPEKLNF